MESLLSKTLMNNGGRICLNMNMNVRRGRLEVDLQL